MVAGRVCRCTHDAGRGPPRAGFPGHLRRDPNWHTGRVSVPLIVLVGPTATGKSRLAVDIACVLRDRGRDAEIVNADSMLVYRGMDIGTAKPDEAERRGVPHHLIDIAEVTERASVADFQVQARAVIARLRERGTVPVMVGGSPLYTRAVIDVFDFPGSDAQVRARWEAELDRVGAHALHAALAERAPESAAAIEPGNGRRIVRALEVLELTGGHRPEIPAWTYALTDVHQFGLNLERAELDRRIDERVEEMWRLGLVDEVRTLLGRGLRDGRTAVRAIGYRQVVAHLDGELTEAEAKADVQRATRAFFRKQLGWYRRDPRITWLDAAAPDNAARVLAGLDSGQAKEVDDA
ncbi:tRNA (adenosine(37)-N6)-dimethylallyltransferase MiaA [Tessaracoccus defluvii]|uniref:tRNA dimethylallyltransferase n=1 Tax=Tessaracoccus defluvii TaxID=1285901 RepID=A0A7H0H7S0_9ACTN|nr:tRNA (adenosine(37)-N6)-dimethylallyltransferase MiaA [Tessaracoccus defluvii]